MKSTLLEAVTERFEHVETERIYSIATLVDPRYKERQVPFFQLHLLYKMLPGSNNVAI